MHRGDDLPLARADQHMAEAIVTMTAKAFGCLGIIDDAGKLVGVITDGDLRRHMGESIMARTTTEIMTRAPRTTTAGTLASAALEDMNRRRITALFVVEDDRPIGVVHVHDFLRAGVV